MIGLIGLDHHWAPAEVRGRLSFVDERQTAALRALAGVPAIDEAILLSTCNRTEIYVAANDWPAARAAVARFLAATHQAGPEARIAPLAAPAANYASGSETIARAPEGSASAPALHPLSTVTELLESADPLAAYLYAEEGPDAARHLFRVAAGLRSMLIGESQILGQVKEALTTAEETESAGEELRSLFVQAIKVGKRARTETQIGRADISLAATAVRVATESLGGLHGKAALLIGAGRTSQLCSQLLRSEGIERLILANRSPLAAAELAAEVGAEVVPLDDVCEAISDVQLIICATAAPHVVLSAATVACGLAGRREPLVIVDLAVPGDVEPTAGLLPQVSLYTLDMLRDHTATPGREPEIQQAEAIVEDGTREWARARQVRQAVPGIAALRRHVDQSEQAELARALTQLSHLSTADRQVIERFGQRLVDKMFHHLVARIRSLAEYDEVAPDITMQVLARLFADPDEGARQER